MSLLDIVRGAVKIANNITRPLQAEVTIEHQLSTSGYGGVKYMKPAKLPALVDWKRAQVRTANGELTMSRAVITFTDVEKLAAATNGEGVGDFDRIILPDGTTGPILDLSGFIDAGTRKPFMTEVMLG